MNRRIEEAKFAILCRPAWPPKRPNIPIPEPTQLAFKWPRSIQARLGSNLRSRLSHAVQHGYRGSSAVRDLGCTLDEFITYIARLFQPEMSWNNYGAWHLDHIKPLAIFDLTIREQVLEACHYTNLRPLWALENLSRPKLRRLRARTP